MSERDTLARDTLADIIHATCVKDWERRFAAGAQAITMHGPDAHLELADRLIAAGVRLAPADTGIDVEALRGACRAWIGMTADEMADFLAAEYDRIRQEGAKADR